MSDTNHFLKVAFVSQGKLFVTQKQGDAVLVSSPFFEQLLERAERERDRNNWKSEGMGWSLGSGRMSPMGADPMAGRREVTRADVQFTGVTSGSVAGEMFYALDTGSVGAMFKADHEGERRLFHRNQFKALDLSRHPQSQKLVFSLPATDGTSHLGTMESTGRFFKQITEGDCRDECPSWISGSENKILFQSAGVGRNQNGYAISHAPYAINELDLATGEMATLVDFPDFDCLLPRMGKDSTIYYLKRPYEGVPKVSAWTPLKDLVLFPFRMVVAIAHFLNFFSMVFSKKPLITSGGPPEASPDSRTMMLWGKLIDAEKQLRSKHPLSGDGLVPDNWQLIARSADGTEKILANGVSSFDLDDAGNLIYTNGTTLFRWSETAAIKIGSGKLIERIAILG